MNEKIKELMKQAGIVYIDDSLLGEIVYVPTDHDDLTKQGKILEKFTELLIQECIKEIHGTDVGYFYGKSYYLDRIAGHIEDKFGLSSSRFQ